MNQREFPTENIHFDLCYSIKLSVDLVTHLVQMGDSEVDLKAN